MFFRGSDHIIGIGSNLGKSAEADWKKGFFHKEDEMKDKVLFANVGIAKFMALLVTLLTMFASCNFVGGQDARTTTTASNDPGKYNGMFKSVIQGLGLQIQAYKNSDDTYTTSAFIDSNGNIVVKKLGWWGCSYGAWDSDGAKLTGKYDVSNVAYVKFDLMADSEGSVYVQVFGDKENKIELELTRESDDVGDNWIEKTDIEINIVNKKEEVSELVIFGSGDGEAHVAGSKIRVENFAFYDENGKEVVPTYIKYADGENPEVPDNPGDGDDGEGTTFNGIFKNPIPGQIDVGIWEGTFTCDDLPELVASGAAGWWGGAFGWIEKEPVWSMPRKYDVSGIVKCSFDVTAVTDVPDAWVVIFPKIEGNDTESDWEDEAKRKTDVKLSAGETKTYSLTFDAAYGKSTNRASLVGFGGGSGGGTLSITNVTFYDRTGKEVVPQIAKDDGNQGVGGGNEDGDTPTKPDDPSSTTLTLGGIEYSCTTWFAEWEWAELKSQPTVENTNDGIKLTVTEANNAADWHGQFKLFGDGVKVVKGTNYDINVVVRTTKDTQGVTFKPTVKEKEDAGAFVVEKKDFKANGDVTFECNKVTAREDGTLAVVFNFHGCEVGTEIFVKKITFKESADQTKDDFVVTGSIPNGVGVLNFGFEGEISDDKSYKIYVGDSETPVITMGGGINNNRKDIEFKQSFNGDLIGYPYCRKVSEVFTKGAGDYDIKVVPVIDGKEDKSKTMTSKYTLSKDSLGWQPTINGMVINPIIGDEKKPTSFIIAYAENTEIDSFNIFVIKSDVDRDRSKGKWWANASGVKSGGAIANFDANDPSVTMKDIFKDGAGEYNVYIEPRNEKGEAGTNFALWTLDVQDSWLSDGTD